MREILFRGKRIDNDEWAYGNFVMDATEQVQREKIPLEPILADGFIRRYDLAQQKIVMHEVDRGTIGQYTGLTDMHGRKVFEGDIVKYINMLDEINAPEIGVVVYEQSECCFEVQRKVKNPENVHISTSTSVVYLVYDNEWCSYEVIGNIHDNPELLKGE